MALIVAAAQYASLPADIEGNLTQHARFITSAAGLGVQLLVFPELSLTGYELSAVADIAVHPHDPRLAPLQVLARKHSMAILAGAPVRVGASLHIGTLAFLPDGLIAVYTKMHLHDGEQTVFASGQGGPILRLGRIHVAMAICADVAEASHASRAAADKANIYAVSVLLSEQGYASDAERLRGYAVNHGMAVVMANHAAPTGDWIPTGRSTIWDEQGRLIAASPANEEALILGRRRAHHWEGDVFSMNPRTSLEAVAEIPSEKEKALAAKPLSDQGDLFASFFDE